MTKHMSIPFLVYHQSNLSDVAHTFAAGAQEAGGETLQQSLRSQADLRAGADTSPPPQATFASLQSTMIACPRCVWAMPRSKRLMSPCLYK